MTDMFHAGQRRLQDEFDTRRLADSIEAGMVRDVLNPKQRAFIESADMFFLATADADGRPTCSYRGGDPGFVRAPDERTLLIPNYDGNGMFLSWGNVVANPEVGLLFIDFMKGWRLRVHGRAEISDTDPLLPTFAGAQFLVRLTVREAFGNCPRYVHKYQLVERSAYVPHEDADPPVPAWKLQPGVRDALPKNDPARKAACEPPK